MAKVLVVDDECDARAFVRAIMEGEGWEVSEAVNGVEGLEKIASEQPDLVVLDVQMPEKDGFQVWADIAARNINIENTKFIMLTGVAEKTGMKFSSDDMGKFFGREPDAYVEKPIDPEAFKATVLEVTQ